jgi:hypothetical protein
MNVLMLHHLTVLKSLAGARPRSARLVVAEQRHALVVTSRYLEYSPRGAQEELRSRYAAASSRAR